MDQATQTPSATESQTATHHDVHDPPEPFIYGPVQRTFKLRVASFQRDSHALFPIKYVEHPVAISNGVGSIITQDLLEELPQRIYQIYGCFNSDLELPTGKDEFFSCKTRAFTAMIRFRLLEGAPLDASLVRAFALVRTFTVVPKGALEPYCGDVRMWLGTTDASLHAVTGPKELELTNSGSGLVYIQTMGERIQI